MIQDILIYFEKNSDQFMTSLFQHLRLSLSAFAIAALIGIVGGFLCVKYQPLKKILLPLVQGLRIIPSLAVLLLLLPVLGTGEIPALVALVLLAVPAIMMNTITGLQSVDPIMMESGKGLGMDQRQLLRNIEIPCALPYIFAGMNTAILEIIASATIAAKIGAGGLGGIIFTGIGLARTDLLLIGGCSVALLAISMRVLLNFIDHCVLRYKYVK